jgi:hypothetical protein
MPKMVKKSFDAPEETRPIKKGKVEVAAAKVRAEYPAQAKAAGL